MEIIVKPLRILIADDHDLMRRGVKTLIESHTGWEVCGEATTGREAVAKVEELEPDVLILGSFNAGGTVKEVPELVSNRLTSREREIVQLLAEGKSSKEVAVSLGISVKTAETHRANVMRKLELHSVSELVRYAVRNQIVEA